MAAGLVTLKRRAEFLRVADARRKFATPGLVLQSAPRPGGDLRVGYTVSRKVGNAVVRNRAKRRLRAAAAIVLADHAVAGHDYVVIGREATPARPFPALRQDLETALRRLGLWRESAAGTA